jgi:hypothetical protein
MCDLLPSNYIQYPLLLYCDIFCEWDDLFFEYLVLIEQEIDLCIRLRNGMCYFVG